MTKWVIKKNSFNKNEVWRYIDTVEEAKRYFYIAEAIKKFGADDILPVAVNRLGGYHYGYFLESYCYKWAEIDLSDIK